MELVDKSFVENCIPEEVSEDEVKNIIDNIVPEMLKIIQEHDGLGLAAPQVGISKKFFIAKDIQDNQFYTYFNAQYFKDSDGKIKMEEGCLSYPDMKPAILKRLKRIRMKYDYLDNGILKTKIKKITGNQAVIFQHEIDHCGNGKSKKAKTAYTR